MTNSRDARSHRDLLDATLAAIRPLSHDAVDAARARQETLTKPPGSMGLLEEVGNRLCGMAGACPPPMPEPAAVVVAAADHGVVAQGVSVWPQDVTIQMLANVLTGGAVVNVLARQVGAGLLALDVGVAAPLPSGIAPARSESPESAPEAADAVKAVPASEAANAARAAARPGGIGFLDRRVAAGTSDLSVAAAMTPDHAVAAVAAGIECALALHSAGVRLLATGDLGIGNTTPSAALVAGLTGRDPAEVTGPGAGGDAEAVARKIDVVRRALQLHRPDPANPLAVLAALGGFEHAALVGVLLGAASVRTPIVLDGVIACSAALVAVAVHPSVHDYLVAGHRSAEPGATAALTHLGLTPLLDQGLRLGEGSGAVLAIPSVQAAARMLREVATFDSAGVSTVTG